MKKLFGREKPKGYKGQFSARDSPNISSSVVPEEAKGHLQQPTFTSLQALEPELRRSSSDDRWEVISTLADSATLHAPHPPTLAGSRSSSVASLPPGASPPVQSPLITPRSSSPFGVSSLSQNRNANVRDREAVREPQVLKRKPVGGAPATAAVGILRALEPQMPHSDALSDITSHSDEGFSVAETVTKESKEMKEEKKERPRFWDRTSTRDREKDKEKERWKDRTQDENQAELTRMIGYLTATASEDWALVLEVCERASANETNAKDAVKALRREFRYAEPSAQLSAARLWAFMLRNSSDLFISQNMSRKFLDTLEDVLVSPRTSPVVKERLLSVLAAAAYASGSKSRNDKDGFRGLWRKIKPLGAPEEGMPFDTDDAMFNPPMPRSTSTFSGKMYQQRQSSPSPDQPKSTPVGPPKRKSSFTQSRIIPLEEDMRRLFQECKLGRGNAGLLSEALAFARPEDLKEKEIIREFHAKCRASQELIYAQIPWASSGAERSRLASGRPGQNKLLAHGTESNASLTSFTPDSDENMPGLTVEEQLLAALLGANEDLLEALRVYDDLERVAIEREAEQVSRLETTADPTQQHRPYEESSGKLGSSSSHFGSSSSRSSSPALSVSSGHQHHTHPLPRIPASLVPSHPTNLTNSPIPSHAAQLAALAQSLAPPPPAPHGPRSPAQLSSSSRTPSPVSNGHSGHNSVESLSIEPVDAFDRLHVEENISRQEPEILTPVKPSAKALGKRRVADSFNSERSYPSGNMHYGSKEDILGHSNDLSDSDSDDGRRPRRRQPVKYVYDAALELRQQRIREGQMLINGVH